MKVKTDSLYRMPVYVWIALLILVPTAGAGMEPVYAQQGMVVTPEPNATQAGLDILRRGGNAFDAAVAMGFALAVTYPAAGNLGGGGFMVGYQPEGTSFFLDFRETAPAAASRDMYLDEDGNVIDGLSTSTLLAVGVPGTVHGLLTVLRDQGSQPAADVIEPAVRLAKNGFEVGYTLSRSLQLASIRLMRHASTQKVFYPNGGAPAFGDRLVQSDLAATLSRIQERGMEGFYQGRTADLLVAYMQRHGGILTHEDLTRYQSKYREPIRFDYKAYRLIAPNLPSSGGVTLAQILKLVEPYNLPAMGFHSADAVQAVVEAERLAFADRNHFLGDSDFVDVPTAALISDEYIRQRRTQLSLDQAGESAGVQHGNPEPAETTHYCVVDRFGNVVAVTYTLNGSYGMGAVVEGAGFLLNNEMDDFSAKPGVPNMYGVTGAEANVVEPGKRMLSSMTPTIVLKDGEFAFTMGTPGGPTIITTVAQIFLNIAEFGMNIREAIDAPRFHHQWLPDEILHEPFAFSADTRRRLIDKGYSLKQRNGIGIAAGIERLPNGILAGYADGRGEGAALGD